METCLWKALDGLPRDSPFSDTPLSWSSKAIESHHGSVVFGVKATLPRQIDIEDLRFLNLCVLTPLGTIHRSKEVSTSGSLFLLPDSTKEKSSSQDHLDLHSTKEPHPSSKSILSLNNSPLPDQFSQVASWLLGSGNLLGRFPPVTQDFPTPWIIKGASCMASRQNNDKATVGQSSPDTWQEFIVITFQEQVTEESEDHLGIYTQEWERFVVMNDRGQHNRKYLLLEKSGVILVDGPLINQIIGFPMQGHEIDPKEKAKRVKRDIIIQRLYQESESTTTLEVPDDIKPYVDMLRQKAKVLKETPLTSLGKEAKLSELKMNYNMLKLKCGILEGKLQSKEEVMEGLQEEIEQKDQDIASNVLEIHKLRMISAQYTNAAKRLVALHTQLATKGCCQMRDTKDWQRIAMRKETIFQRQVRSSQLKQQAMNLIRKTDKILEDALQFTKFEGQEVEELSQQTRAFISLKHEMRQTQTKLAHLFKKGTGTEMILYQTPFVMPSSLARTSTQGPSPIEPRPSKSQDPMILLPLLETLVPDTSREEISAPRIHEDKVGTTSGDLDPKALTTSSPSRVVVLELLIENLVTTPPKESEELVHIITAIVPRQEPVEAVVPETVPLAQCEPSVSGTKRDELENESPQTAIRDVATSSSIPKVHRSKRTNPPSLGGPSGTRVKK
eukprot:Gb_28907 [translate_table: standard]